MSSLTQDDIDNGPWFIDQDNYRVVSTAQVRDAIHDAEDLKAFRPDFFGSVVTEDCYKRKLDAYAILEKMIKADVRDAYNKVDTINAALVALNKELHEYKKKI